MHPILITFGNYPLRTYSVLFALAFLLGFGVTLYVAKLLHHSDLTTHYWNLAPWLLVSGLIGARIWQVAFFAPHFYAQHPDAMLTIWHGGLSIQGGIVGALVCSLIYLHRHRVPFWPMADTAAPGLLIGQSIGRDANLLNGDAFGDPTQHPYGLLYPAGSPAHVTFSGAPVWPAEVWEGEADVILFALLLIFMQKRRPDGAVFLVYVVMYSAVRFGLESLRGDSGRYLWHLDAAQWTSVPVLIIALMLLYWRSRRAQPTH